MAQAVNAPRGEGSLTAAAHKGKKKRKKRKKNAPKIIHQNLTAACASASFGQYTAMMQGLTCANVTHGQFIFKLKQ